MPPLSVILLTTGKMPLIRYSLKSLVCQIREIDECIISINSNNSESICAVKKIVEKIGKGKRIRVIQTNSEISVYEHYKFAHENAVHEHLLIAHDDEIYNASIVKELSKAFTHPEVNVAVGGMLKVIPQTGGEPYSSIENHFEIPEKKNGLTWIIQTEGLYPRFCFSALAFRKDALKSDIFSAASTSADCLAVTQLAMDGEVYCSKEIFATWLQLPGRNSRWYVLQPGLTAPWQEYMEYYKKSGIQDLINRAELARKKSLWWFFRLIWIVGVRRRSRRLILGGLEKIRVINPWMATLLLPVSLQCIYYPLSLPIRAAEVLLKNHKKRYSRRHSVSQPHRLLKIDKEFWDDYIRAVGEIIKS